MGKHWASAITLLALVAVGGCGSAVSEPSTARATVAPADDLVNDFAATCESGRAFGGAFDIVSAPESAQARSIPVRPEDAAAPVLQGALFSDVPEAELAEPEPTDTSLQARGTDPETDTSALTFPVTDESSTVIGTITVEEQDNGAYKPVSMQRCSE